VWMLHFVQLPVHVYTMYRDANHKKSTYLKQVLGKQKYTSLNLKESDKMHYEGKF